MNRTILGPMALFGIVSLAACSGGSLIPQSVPASQQAASGDIPFLSANPVRQLCPSPAAPGQMQCFALVRTDIVAGVAATPRSLKCPFAPKDGYCASDLQSAYNLPSLAAGKDQTVAVIDAYGYDKAASDLAVYRRTMGLKACTVASGCLRIVNQEGETSSLPKQPPLSDDWKGEESLDIDMVSAICPNCKIVLVQANNDFTSNLDAGLKAAVKLGAKYVSNSYGGGPESADDPAFDQPGVVITASAGDCGGGGAACGSRADSGPQQPCSYTYVVCTGGTHLVRASNARGWSETVWNDWAVECSGGERCGATGSGCSTKIAKPSWQNATGCRMRSESDVSATASLRAPVIIYNSEEVSNPKYFLDYGGTSVSAPIVAAVYALAGNAGAQLGARSIWKRRAGTLNDIVKGNNIDAKIKVTCASTVKYICTARAGYDGPTGWGTPNGVGAF